MGAATWAAFLLALAGVLATNLATYMVARRAHSGRIVSSEAGQLWAESASVRGDLQRELAAVRAEVHAVRAEARDCQAQLRRTEGKLKRAERACRECQERLGLILAGGPAAGP